MDRVQWYIHSAAESYRSSPEKGTEEARWTIPMSSKCEGLLLVSKCDSRSNHSVNSLIAHLVQTVFLTSVIGAAAPAVVVKLVVEQMQSLLSERKQVGLPGTTYEP
ncbi:hypothetical protein CVT25_000248 [Psilocybe cyanescens]|uniref:Uncharacterized protein n=1 Tax=Psilocybe cyanescens TaxID=93625 RepID=A0A409XRV4_PSICY|nr:hypothetical protein CVT25_000248 [Psilocybe cyanescens]